MSLEERFKYSVPFTWRNFGNFHAALKQVVAHERKAVQEFVDDEVATLKGKIAALKDEVTMLRAEFRAANELADLRRQVEILRNDRVLDLTAVPTRKTGAA